MLFLMGKYSPKRLSKALILGPLWYGISCRRPAGRGLRRDINKTSIFKYYLLEKFRWCLNPYHAEYFYTFHVQCSLLTLSFMNIQAKLHPL